MNGFLNHLFDEIDRGNWDAVMVAVVIILVVCMRYWKGSDDR